MELNPQKQQMADESMVRNLAAQVEAIWPQERELLARHRLPEDVAILDAGCGTGEATGRLADLFPRSTVLGVDVLEAHLDLARRRHAALGDRVRFEAGSIFELRLPDHTFDLVACRHVLQSIPRPERALAELVRVTKPGGRLHLIAEDYGMIHFAGSRLGADAFWAEGPASFGARTGTDMRIGRSTFGLLRALGLGSLTIDYVVVDTLRVPRGTFAAIWEAWRDGYTDVLAAHSRFTREEVLAHFEEQLAILRDPDGYAVWLVPVVGAVVG